MKKSLYLAIIILISSISLFSTTSSFAATTSSSADYRNGSDIQSDNVSATTSSSADYRNGSDIQSDNVSATTSSSSDYRNGSDIQSDNASATTSSSADYRNGSDIQSDNATTAAAANQSNTTNTSTDTNNVLGIESGKLRSGNVDMNTIPTVILSIVKTLLGIAGTVAIFSLIYHAVQMQLNSGITGDSSGVDKAKKGMTGALIGFVIAIAAWFLVTRAVDLLAAVS